MSLAKAISLKPGIHDAVPANWYHADPTGKPSLSSGIAKLLVSKSPAHAREAHPILNPNLEREDDDKFSIGTTAHELFLRGENCMAVYEADSWRTQASKDFKADARAQGLVPLLPGQAERVQAMVEAARTGLAMSHAQPPLFADGKPEQTLVWEDDHGVICRARLDWLRDDFTAADDLKSTSASAEPRAWLRTAYGMGADIQVAFYVRGVEKLTGVRPVFRYAVVETYPPYALSVVDLAPSAMSLAEEKVQRAIDLWATCLERDFWPAYPRGVASLELPGWEEERWLERQETAA